MYDYLRLCAAAMLAFYLASPYLEVEHVWGAGGFFAIPLAARLLLVAATLPLFSRRVAERCWAALVRAVTAVRGRVGVDLLASLAAIASVGVFWAARLGHLHWGDGYIFANAISHPDARLTYSWQSPLDVFLHAKLWAAANAAWGWDVWTTYAIVSCLAGGLFVFVLVQAVAELAEDTSGRLAGVALFLSLGAMQLFFGYVESYTILPVCILVFLWYGLRFLTRKGPMWPAAVALALAHGLSPSTLPLSLALAYLAYRAWRRREAGPDRLAAEMASPMLVVGALVLALMTAGGHGLSYLFSADAPGGGDGRWFVPLVQTQTRWEHYTMLSWAHLRDFLNEQALVAPFGLLLVAGVFWRERRQRIWRQPAVAFLAIAAGAYLLLSFVWNTDYGGRRDWDLFAPASLPLMALATYLVSRYLPRSERDACVPLVAAVSVVHLIPWVYFNSLPWPW
ncbi:MAG: hypothetical protein ACYC5O_07765 [Anaerolineae bacterium]